MGDMPQGRGERDKRWRGCAPVQRLRGVEVVVRGSPQIITQAQVHGEIRGHLPVVLSVSGYPPLTGSGERNTLWSDNAGGYAEHKIRAVVSTLVARRIGTVVGCLRAVEGDLPVRRVAAVGIVLTVADVAAEGQRMLAVRPGDVVDQLVGDAVIDADARIFTQAD